MEKITLILLLMARKLASAGLSNIKSGGPWTGNNNLVRRLKTVAIHCETCRK